MKRSAFLNSSCFTALVLLIACGEGTTEPETPNATGVWSGGMVTDFGGARILHLTLLEEANGVSGTGDFADASGTPYYTFTLSGTHVHPAISLVLNSIINLEGTFTSSTTITATVNGSGWVNAPVTLTRQ